MDLANLSEDILLDMHLEITDFSMLVWQKIAYGQIAKQQR